MSDDSATSTARGSSLVRHRGIVLGSGTRPNIVGEAQRLEPLLTRYLDVVACDFSGTRDLSHLEADVAVVFGGDGSILRSALQMGRRQIPILAVNLGKLGFLADISPAELPAALEDFCCGRSEIIEHLMFECRVFRGQHLLYQQLGLNEVAVHSGAPYSILRIDLYVDSELVTTYSCDGLIISTPVGSTAHSLSAGGPILRKDLSAFVVSPISPHTLTNRPVVDSAERIYELVVEQPGLQTSVVVDGRVLCTLQGNDRVRVERAEPRFKLVATPGHSYYRTLREKLGWGGQFNMNHRP